MYIYDDATWQRESILKIFTLLSQSCKHCCVDGIPFIDPSINLGIDQPVFLENPKLI